MALVKQALVPHQGGDVQLSGTAEPPDEDYAGPQTPPRHSISFAASLAGGGLISYLACVWIICTSNLNDRGMAEKFSAQVDDIAYQWPMIAFGTAFALNSVTLGFERESSKFQLALLACYINLIAFINDYLAWQGTLPIVKDVWGHGLHLGRHVMWLHATPAMVYLLSIISDFSRDRVTVAMAVDVCMLSLAILAHLTDDKLTSVLAFMGTFCCFFYVVNSLWSMFDAPLSTAHNDSSTMSLKVLRFTTVGLWYMFPSIWTLARCGLLSINMQEWLWTCCDFMGKVMFSSSLLEGNFLSIEARRLIAMRIVEEGNRVQVIQELKELVEQKERFMSGMSHELRTPLNGIIGLSEALVMGSCGQINDAAIKTISTIKTSGARLLNLINDILDAASMRQMKGQLTIKQEKVVLSRIVRDVIDLCQPLAKRGVKLVGNLPENIPPVLGDTGRLIQIFHNLIGNSCKFTHTGTISITATHKMDEVEVAVSDSGIGIPEEKFSTVFLAFEQVDMSTTRKYGGTGLGLNLVKQLVEAHGGRIEVRSKLGVGTTFFFSLPVWDDSLAEDADGLSSSGLLTPGSAARRKSMSGSGGKLLVRSHSREAPGVAVTSPAPPPSSSNRKGNAPPPVKRSSFRSTSSCLGQPSRVKRVSHDSNPSYAPPPDVGKARSDSDKASGSGTPTQEAGLGLGQKAGASVGTGTGSGASEPRQTRTGYDASNVTGPLPLDDAMLLASVVKRRAGSLAGLRTAGSSPAKIHVLSVDDDPTNQMVIQSLLGGDKYQITQAMTGQEALDVLAEMEELPDVILLDVMMPGMSGYETCCQIRETYPLSCVPIIMISAKGKEENIVEGLRSGSNDYVIKPFGRQEILARITAHLRFRDETYTAGEIAASDSDGPPSASACLAPLMDIQGYGTSLPQGLATALESGQGNNVQVYKQLTMLSVELVNHQAWAARCPVDEVVTAMTRFHIQLDQALQAHGGYCVDDPAQAHLTILTGLKGEADQVSRALNIMVALLDEVEGDGQQPDEMRLVLAGSLHMLPAQGVVVGTSHPVMQLTGQLPADSANLLAMAPPGNLLISSHAHGALEASDKAQLVPAAEWRGSTTYLLQRREIDSHIQFVSAEAPKMSNLPSQVATNACRLQPVQRSMMELVRISPMHMFELGNTTLAAAMGKAGANETSSRAAQQLLQTMASYNASMGGPSVSAANPAPRSPLGGTPFARAARGTAATASARVGADVVGFSTGSGSGSVETREVDKLLHSNAMLTRQLDETAQEVERLALEVESLTEQLAVARASVGAATSGPARDTGASGRLAVGRSQLSKETDGDLSAALARVSDLEMELATAKAEAAIAERRLVAMQDAMVRAYETHTMPMSTAPPSPPSTQPMGLMYARTASSILERRQGHSMSAGGHLVGTHAGRATSELRLRMGGNDDALSRSPRSLSQVKRAASTAGDFTPQLVLPPEAFDDITVLLEELGLQELLPRFQDEQITPDVLPHLSEDALRDLGVTTLGARLKIRLASAALANN